MKFLVTGALLLAGLINFYPVVGVISVEQLVKLYDIPLADPDQIILLRHRAILFGLLGAFIIYSAFRNSFQVMACIAGLVSMISFIVIAYAVGDFGDAFNKIIVADIVGSIALVVVLVARSWAPPDEAQTG